MSLVRRYDSLSFFLIQKQRQQSSKHVEEWILIPIVLSRSASTYVHRLRLSGSGGLPGSSLLQMNQSAIRMAPIAATKLPTYPKNSSPGNSNIRTIKVAIRARYEIRKK